MSNVGPVILVVFSMLGVVWFFNVISDWSVTNGRMLPWLRQQSWWPVASDHAAETLLHASLTPAEYRQLAANAYLDVPSPGHAGRFYRIPRGPGQVLVYEDGHVLERLCVQPVENLPEADVILAHKLLIEADEMTYLQTANHFPRSIWH
jgi:hypothetical protein